MPRRKPAAVDNPVEESGSSAVARAAEELADAAEMLAASGGAQGGSRRRKRHHRVRKLLVMSGVVSIAYVLITKTPLKAKLSELVFGPPLDDDEPESITLPVKEPVAKAAKTKPEVETKKDGAGKSTGADDG
jgi:hypothetical protein